MMASRGGSRKPLLPDFHLWTDVTETVLPLRPRRRTRLNAPLPLPASEPQPVKAPKIIVQGPYQPSGAPGAPPVGVIEPKLRQKLGRGRVPIDGTLDLHGMRQEE